MITIKDIKHLIITHCNYTHFDCRTIICGDCPFNLNYRHDMYFCGGYDNHFNWKDMKTSKVRTLKGLLKFKHPNNNKEYPNLK